MIGALARRGAGLLTAFHGAAHSAVVRCRITPCLQGQRFAASRVSAFSSLVSSPDAPLQQTDTAREAIISAVRSTFGSTELKSMRESANNYRQQFRDVFVRGDTPEAAARALDEWMQTYYRRPRPDLLVAALLHAHTVPGAFTGTAAFPGAVFMSYIMSQAFRSKDDAAALLQMLRLAMAARLDEAAEQGASGEYIGALSQQMSEQTDTVLRALYLCNNASVDTLISEFAEAHRQETTHRFHSQRQAIEEFLASRAEWKDKRQGGARADAGEGDEAEVDAEAEEELRSELSDERLEDLLALATSLLPPPPVGAHARIRADPRHWPVPAFNITAFEQHIAKQQFSLYGCSRHLFMHTHAAHRLAKKNPASFAVFSPHLATVVTKSLVDGYWAWFYATGTGSALSKVADVGTLFLPFFGEYGDFPVASYGQEAGTSMDLGYGPSASGKGRGDKIIRTVPDWEAEFEEDPLGHMGFECGRYALHTLLKTVGLHAHAGEVFLHEAQQMADQAAMMDPFTRADKLGLAGEQRLEIVRMLAPTVEVLHEGAKQHGIGSGIWPESYNRSGPSSGGVAAIDVGSSGGLPVQAAPAQQSIDLAAATRAALRDMTSSSTAASGAPASSSSGSAVAASALSTDDAAAAAAQAVAAVSSISSRMEAARHARELDNFWRKRRPFNM